MLIPRVLPDISEIIAIVILAYHLGLALALAFFDVVFSFFYFLYCPLPFSFSVALFLPVGDQPFGSELNIYFCYFCPISQTGLCSQVEPNISTTYFFHLFHVLTSLDPSAAPILFRWSLLSFVSICLFFFKNAFLFQLMFNWIRALPAHLFGPPFHIQP